MCLFFLIANNLVYSHFTRSPKNNTRVSCTSVVKKHVISYNGTIPWNDSDILSYCIPDDLHELLVNGLFSAIWLIILCYFDKGILMLLNLYCTMLN